MVVAAAQQDRPGASAARPVRQELLKKPKRPVPSGRPERMVDSAADVAAPPKPPAAAAPPKPQAAAASAKPSAAAAPPKPPAAAAAPKPPAAAAAPSKPPAAATPCKLPTAAATPPKPPVAATPPTSADSTQKEAPAANSTESLLLPKPQRLPPQSPQAATVKGKGQVEAFKPFFPISKVRQWGKLPKEFWPKEDELVRRIRAAPTVQLVVQLVRAGQAEGVMSPGVIDAALNRVELLEAPPSKLALSGFATGAEHAYGAVPLHFRRYYSGSSKDGQEAVRLLTLLCMRYLRWCSARVVRSLVRCAHSTGLELSRAQQRAAMARFLNQLDGASGQDVANVMWATGSAPEWELRTEDVVQILERAAEVAEDGGSDFTLQTAGNIFLGTARWLERLEEQDPGREIFPVRQALVRSGVCDVIAWAAVSLVEQGDSASHGPGGLLLNCSVLVYSWGALGWQPNSRRRDGPLTRLLGSLVKVIQETEPGAQRSAAAATALFGLCKLYGLEVQAPLPTHLHAMVAQLAAAVPWEHVGASSTAQAAYMDSVCIAAASLGTLGFEIDCDVWRHMLAPLVADPPVQLSDVERCSQLLMGLATVAQHCKPLVLPAAERVVESIFNQLDEAGPETLSRAAWSVALLQDVSPKLSVRLVTLGYQAAGTCQRGTRQHTLSLSQLHQASMLLAADGIEVSVPELLEEEAADIWQSTLQGRTVTVARSFEEEGVLPPTLHGEVSRALNSMGVAHACEQLTDDYMLSVDIIIPQQQQGEEAGAEGSGSGSSSGGDGSSSSAAAKPAGIGSTKRIAIEVDGFRHYTVNTLQPTGRELARNRLLAARGLEVIVVPGHEWGAQKGLEAQQSYLRGKLEAAGYVFGGAEVAPSTP